MARKNPVIQFNSIIKRIEKTILDAVKPNALKPTAEFAANVVVKRTRLGYGVDASNAAKKKLAKLSKRYVEKRKIFDGLSELTRPNKSNLTRTGQMLASVKPFIKDGEIIIKPTGRRNDGKNNYDIAQYNQIGGMNRPPRIFMNISQLEFAQTVRFYRKTFTTLLRKLKLI